MARTKLTVTKKNLEKLKSATCQTYGRRITRSLECEGLSRDIGASTSLYISPQTLRRLFGFIATQFSPAARTLEALSIYNGYAHWDDFTNLDVSDEFKSLTLAQEAAFYLNFFKIDVKEEADMNFHNASRNVALRILSNPALLSRLTPALAKNPVSQVYFFERFPYLDGLCTDYTRSIKIYMQKKGVTSHLFGNSLLFLSAFLSQNSGNMHFYIKQINKFKIQNTLHPFMIARHIGSNILYRSENNQSCDELLKLAMEYNEYFLRNNKQGVWCYPFFQHCIAEYLHFAEFYDESAHILKLLDLQLVKYEIEDGYEKALSVNYHLATNHQNQLKFRNWIQSPDAFDGINPLFKNFYKLPAYARYITITNDKKEKQRAGHTLQELINKTGYIFFQKYLYK